MPASHSTLRKGTSPASTTRAQPTGWRARGSQVVQVVIEVVVLAIVCLSPWAFGSVEPLFEFALDAGVALLLLLWAGRLLLDGRVTWHRCPALLCLAGLFIVGVWQVMPLSPR